jgi:hypothetical protein
MPKSKSKLEIATQDAVFEEVSEAQMTTLLNILKHHQNTLMTYKGVYKVDIGYRWKGKKMTNEIALRVHVQKKLPKKDLENQDIVPEKLGDFPVDVIQSNIAQDYPSDVVQTESNGKTNNPKRHDPLIGGVETWNIEVRNIGTLGAIVYDRLDSHQPMALSNFHVFVKGNTRQVIGNNVTQPCSGLGNAEDIIGTVHRSDEALDCAVALLTTPRRISSSLLGIPGGIKGIVAPILGMRVMKSGCATSNTHGMIEGVGAENESEFTIVPVPKEWDKKEISDAGDSGSIWIEQSSHAAVGLHFAGETSPALKDERAWSKNIQHVANKLNIDVHKKSILPANSDNSPAITALNDHILISWTEKNTYQLNFMTSFDGYIFKKNDILYDGIPMFEKSSVAPSLTTFNNNYFAGWIDTTSNNIQIMRSSDGINWSNKTVLNEQTDSTLSLCSFKNKLFMAWRDLDTNQLTIQRSIDGIKWTHKSVLGEISDFSPSIATLGKKLYIVWRDKNSQQINIMESTNGQVFTNKVSIGETTAHAPFLVADSKTLFLTWQSMGNNRLNIKESINGTKWDKKIMLRETCIECPRLVPITVKISDKTASTLIVWAWTAPNANRTVHTMVYDIL